MIEHDKFIEPIEPNYAVNFEISSNTDSNEKLLLIFNKETGLAPYYHEFVKGFQDPQILSGFISAISSFIGEVTGRDHMQWKTVFGSDSIILVESGEWSVGVLVVSKETSEIRSKLRQIIREFEDCFEYLRDIEGIQNTFTDFDCYIRRMFAEERITNRTIVTKSSDWRNNKSSFDLPSTTFDVLKTLTGFEGSASVQEIANNQHLPLERVIDLVSIAYWNGIIKLIYIPSDDDILDLSEKASAILFKKGNPINLSNSCLRTVALLNGRTPLSQIFHAKNNHEKNSLLFQLGTLINNGLVERISIEKRVVLFNECLLSQFVSKSASIVGSQRIKNYFDAVGARGISIHPRVSRIVLLDDMKVNCLLEESMTPDDLEEMFEALEYFINEIMKRLTKQCGLGVTEDLFEESNSYCRQRWKPYLSDVMI